MNHTVIDASGEIVSTLSASDLSIIEANTPDGCTSLEGLPPDWNSYYSNGQWVKKPDQPEPFHVWDSLSKSWVDPRSLDQAKADKWDEIKAQRESSIGSTFTWDGSSFDCDATSQVRIQGGVLDAMVAAQQSQPFSVAWTLADNTVRTLNASDMVQVGLAMATAVRSNFSRGQSLRASIDAATSVGQLESIQWD